MNYPWEREHRDRTAERYKIENGTVRINYGEKEDLLCYEYQKFPNILLLHCLDNDWMYPIYRN